MMRSLGTLGAPTKKRVIDMLREHVPGRWTYRGMPSTWTHESGLVIRACAHCAPRYDGDDDSFVTVYRREDTGDIIYPFTGWGLK